jgi:hypothetical protein
MGEAGVHEAVIKTDPILEAVIQATNAKEEALFVEEATVYCSSIYRSAYISGLSVWSSSSTKRQQLPDSLIKASKRDRDQYELTEALVRALWDGKELGLIFG